MFRSVLLVCIIYQIEINGILRLQFSIYRYVVAIRGIRDHLLLFLWRKFPEHLNVTTLRAGRIIFAEIGNHNILAGLEYAFEGF
jgi:hypothetical protein